MMVFYIMNKIEKIFLGYSRFINPSKIDALTSIGFKHFFGKAKGSYIYDENNNAYLDMVSGFGSCILGHDCQELRSKLIESLTSLKPNINPWCITEEAVLLAEKYSKNDHSNKWLENGPKHSDTSLLVADLEVSPCKEVQKLSVLPELFYIFKIESLARPNDSYLHFQESIAEI